MCKAKLKSNKTAAQHTALDSISVMDYVFCDTGAEGLVCWRRGAIGGTRIVRMQRLGSVWVIEWSLCWPSGIREMNE